jgi:hypothetical protein
MSRILQSMPQVAVLLPTSFKVSRDMRRGVLQYVRRYGPWGLHIIEGRRGEQKLIRMNEWGCTGIIGRLYTPELVEIAARAKVPQVLVDSEERRLAKSHPIHRHSVVRSDTAAVGRLAAAFFWNVASSTTPMSASPMASCGLCGAAKHSHARCARPVTNVRFTGH